MQPNIHRSLATAWLVCAAIATALLLWTSCAQMATTAAADDPFAVLAAKVLATPAAATRSVRIDRPDGNPATDALVFFVPGTPNVDERAAPRAAAERWPGDEPRQLAVQARDGLRLAVDARGCVQSPTGGRMFAFAGEHAANRFVDHATASLQLIAPHACTVEVMDDAGQPVAGAPLAVRSANGLLLGRHTTGSDGTRALRLLLSAPNATTIGLRIGSDTPITAPLPANSGRVRLTMPKTTTLTATFVGELVPRRALSFALKCRGLEQPIPGEPTGERSATWPFVAIGSEATVTVLLSAPEPLGTVASAQATATVTANAPALELGATFTSASVVVQVLDLAGQPAAHRAFTLRIQQGDARRLRHIRADAEGWVELGLPGGFDGEQPVTFVLDLHADAAETEFAFAAGELPPTVRRSTGPKVGRAQLELHLREPVRRRLDPIRCQPMPVLAAGQLVLPDGSAPGTPITLTTDEGLRVRTDEAGRFELRGEARDADREFERRRDPEYLASRRKKNGPPTTTTHVEIEREWCFGGDSPWSFELAHGAVDDRIVVQRTRSLPLHPELATPDLVAFAFRLEPSGRRGRRVPVEIDGRERKLPLPNGAWHLVAHAGVLDLARWEDVCTDDRDEPRPASLDWRPFARLVELRVVDRAGRPLDDCIVRLREEETSCAPKDGLVRILVPLEGANVDVRSRIGHRVALDLLDENQTVVLDDRPQLQVKLRPVPELPAGIVLELAIGGGDPVAFDEGGSASAVAAGEGTFTPTLRLRKGMARSEPLEWDLPSIRLAQAFRRLPVDITPERRRVLEAAVAELRER